LQAFASDYVPGDIETRRRQPSPLLPHSRANLDTAIWENLPTCRVAYNGPALSEILFILGNAGDLMGYSLWMTLIVIVEEGNELAPRIG